MQKSTSDDDSDALNSGVSSARDGARAAGDAADVNGDFIKGAVEDTDDAIKDTID